MPRALTLNQIIDRTPSTTLLKVIGLGRGKTYSNPHSKSGKSKARTVECICTCGSIKEYSINHFLAGKVHACGCTRLAKLRSKRKYTKTIPEISSLYNRMIMRCYDPNHLSYEGYGGRGVRVCTEWVDSYQTFLTWCLDNGWKKGLQLDKDIKGNGLLYSPETCSFVTRYDNMNNRRNTVRVVYKGEYMTLKDLSVKEGVPYGLLYSRRKHRPHKLEEIVNKLKNQRTLMNKIPTASEFIKAKSEANPLMKGMETNIALQDLIIEFARLHVQTALESVNENLEFHHDGFPLNLPSNYKVNKNSILNAYPLTNIK